jgi:hypothetical protein
MTGTQLLAVLMVVAGGLLWTLRIPLKNPPPYAKTPSGKGSSRRAVVTASR